MFDGWKNYVTATMHENQQKERKERKKNKQLFNPSKNNMYANISNKPCKALLRCTQVQYFSLANQPLPLTVIEKIEY